MASKRELEEVVSQVSFNDIVAVLIANQTLPLQLEGL